MARPRLTAKEEHAIRKRLQSFVDERYGGDWAALAGWIGVERTTWYPWTGQGKKKGLPQAATLVRMAERCRLSLDWLLTGRGQAQWHDGPIGESLPDHIRHALVSEYAASEPGVLASYHTPEGRQHGRPTPAEVERAVPPAATVYRLCVEFLRPMVRESLGPLRQAELFADAIEHDSERRRTLGEQKVAALVRKRRRDAEQAVANHHAVADGLAAYAADQHRRDRPAYQWVADRLDGGG
jgi:hypothetical protein